MSQLEIEYSFEPDSEDRPKAIQCLVYLSPLQESFDAIGPGGHLQEFRTNGWEVTGILGDGLTEADKQQIKEHFQDYSHEE